MTSFVDGGWPVWLAWLLAGFYFVNGILNWRNIEAFREGYARWKLPPWFNRFNGTVELITAVLLVVPALRPAGLMLSFAICAGIFSVLVYHREYSRLPPGIILYLVTGLAAWGLYG